MADPLIGGHIGNFVVTELVGAGAMGTVYRGEHSLLRHAVAIKVMRALGAPTAQQQQLKRRFIREAEALSKLPTGRHVVRLFDFGQIADGRLYYVMEFLHGHDLAAELRDKGRFSLREAWPYLEQICAGLQTAHAQCIIHRDLKPDNIFVVRGSSLEIKLIDFGIAKLLEASSTLSRGLLGSPLYAAPEQVCGEHHRVGPWTDVYALGVVAYQMLSGELPFVWSEGLDTRQLFQLTVTQQPVALRLKAPWISAEASALVHRCLAKDCQSRPRSVQAVADAFSRLVNRAEQGSETSPGLAAPPTAVDIEDRAQDAGTLGTEGILRRLRPRYAIAAVLMLAILVLGLVAGSFRPGSVPAETVSEAKPKTKPPVARTPAEVGASPAVTRDENPGRVGGATKQRLRASRVPRAQRRRMAEVSSEGSARPRPARVTRPESVYRARRKVVRSAAVYPYDTDHPVR